MTKQTGSARKPKKQRYSYVTQLDDCSGEIPRGFRNRQWVRITIIPAKPIKAGK